MPHDPAHPRTDPITPNGRRGSRDRGATLPDAGSPASDPEATRAAVGPAAPDAGIPHGPATSRVPGYEIVRELGRGGMGVVYEARQVGLHRTVALKMILSGDYASAADVARFCSEAEAIARLQHPAVVQIYEIGECQGVPYFSLEFCPGGSLDRKLGGTPLPPREAARLVEKLARGIGAAHERHIIHRDLKPGNVLLDSDGEPKVTDFGLAKDLDSAGPTPSGTILGTPSYMAPEQAGAKVKELGPACDIYSLGAILYACLTGRPPFRAATPMETVLQVLTQDPVAPRQLQPGVPRDLKTVCLKCLRKDPARRYASAGDLADDLRRFLDGQPIHARPVSAIEKGLKWGRRNPALASLAAALALLAFGVVIGSVLVAFRLEARRVEAVDAAGAAEWARTGEALAKTEALRKLELAAFAQARAVRWSGRPGHRREAIAALAEAAGLARALDLPEGHVRELCDEAVATLALPIDARPGREWVATSEVWYDPAVLHATEHTRTGELTVRTVADGKEVQRLPGWDRDGIDATAAFSPDGRWLAAVYIDNRVPGGRIHSYRIWDWQKKELSVERRAGAFPVGWIDWSADGRRFAVRNNWEGGLFVYETASGRLLQKITTDQGVPTATFTPTATGSRTRRRRRSTSAT